MQTIEPCDIRSRTVALIPGSRRRKRFSGATLITRASHPGAKERQSGVGEGVGVTGAVVEETVGLIVWRPVSVGPEFCGVGDGAGDSVRGFPTMALESPSPSSPESAKTPPAATRARAPRPTAIAAIGDRLEPDRWPAASGRSPTMNAPQLWQWLAPVASLLPQAEQYTSVTP